MSKRGSRGQWKISYCHRTKLRRPKEVRGRADRAAIGTLPPTMLLRSIKATQIEDLGTKANLQVWMRQVLRISLPSRVQRRIPACKGNPAELSFHRKSCSRSNILPVSSTGQGNGETTSFAGIDSKGINRKRVERRTLFACQMLRPRLNSGVGTTLVQGGNV